MSPNLYKGIFYFVLLYSILLAFLVIKSAISPTKSGFHCSDQSISHPKIREYVTRAELLLHNILTPLIFVIGIELYLGKWAKATLKVGSYVIELPDVALNIVRYLANWNFLYIVIYIFTGIVKVSYTRLRPNFLALCQPDADCSVKDLFISDYICLGDRKAARNAHKSFFSAHASLAAYTALWTALYIEIRLRRELKSGRLIVAVIAFAVFLSGLLIGISRIFDNYHHLSDVTVGMLVGCTVAYVNYRFLNYYDAFQFSELLEPQQIASKDKKTN